MKKAALSVLFLNPIPTPFRQSLPSHRPRHAPQPVCHTPHPVWKPSDVYVTLGDKSDENSTLCRLITGLAPSTLTPTSGYTPNPVDTARAIDALVDAGLHSFDVGTNHASSTDAATYAREYVRLVGPSAARSLRFCTQVEIRPTQMDAVHRNSVQRVVDRELARIGRDRIDLFQLAWSDFRDKRYVDFLGELHDFKRDGKVAVIGTIDFPTYELRHLASQQIHVASNQVAFSLVDRRAMVDMADWCRSRQIALLAYSVRGAGFISEKFLGLPEPTSKVCTDNRLARFAATVRLWGGWSLFQELLFAVSHVAKKHHVSMPHVAIKWALQQPALAAVVVRARLGMPPETDRCVSNLQAFNFTLDEDDYHLLDSIAQKGNDLHSILGDCGNELQPRTR